MTVYELCELIADLATAKLGDLKSNLYHILNRYENGDHYGIERNEKPIYINGTKATKSDTARLLADLKNGTQRATARTKNGITEITTEF